MNPKPASRMQRATPAGSRSMRTPSASSTSAEPDADETARFPFVKATALDAAVLDLIPDTPAFDLAVTYADRKPVLYVDHLAGKYLPQTVDAAPRGAAAIAAFDFNGDSFTDLALTAADGITLLRNRDARFEPADPAAAHRHRIGVRDIELDHAAVAAALDPQYALDIDDMTAVHAQESGRVQPGLDVADRQRTEQFRGSVEKAATRRSTTWAITPPVAFGQSNLSNRARCGIARRRDVVRE